MADRTYENTAIRVHWKPDLCAHSSECVKAQPGVFDPHRRPWVDVDAADADDVAEAVERCPSGALSYERLDDAAGGHGASKVEAQAVAVTITDNGPVLLSEEIVVKDAAGNVLKPAGKKAALCRCGMSGTKPFCDGSHKSEGWQA